MRESSKRDVCAGKTTCNAAWLSETCKNEVNSSSIAVVLGGGNITGYSVIQELAECGVTDIALIDAPGSMCRHSRLLKWFIPFEGRVEQLEASIQQLEKTGKRVVVFPTTDSAVRLLGAIQERGAVNSYLTANLKKASEFEDKDKQYVVARSVGVDVPKSAVVAGNDDWVAAREVGFPVILRLIDCTDQQKKRLFKTRICENREQLECVERMLTPHFSRGMKCLVSEYIAGPDCDVWAYSAFVGDGAPLRSWVGRKLSQYPVGRGVFATAVAQKNDVVSDLGARLVTAFGVDGFVEPEFKYDAKSDRYVLMEVNFRPMMWNRVGRLAKVDLIYAQILFANGCVVAPQEQVDGVRLCYLRHELGNLIAEKGYWKTFVANAVGPKAKYLGAEFADPIPFLIDVFRSYLKTLGAACLRRLKQN
jgi:predicted ATP-grasp superfamily ATP-dependent carboligase